VYRLAIPVLYPGRNAEKRAEKQIVAVNEQQFGGYGRLLDSNNIPELAGVNSCPTARWKNGNYEG
jgi:hypothetical protein